MTQALLALEDGTLFWGVSLGALGETVGEVVFNTSLTGYQEIITDPSYFKQIVTLTYPHIGNVGINDEDSESKKVMAQGLIIKDCPVVLSNFRAQKTLPDYLKEQNIVAIADIDTRKLTRHLRTHGNMSGAIVAGDTIDAQAAVAKAKGFAGLNGMDLAKEVSTAKTYEWTQGSWSLGQGHADCSANTGYHVVVYDYGIKHNILRILADRGCKVTVVPAQTPAAEVLAMQPDGVFLSNGPGDPAPCDYAIKAIQDILKTETPIFGICLGHQLLALATGAKTMKMKFGHHGANHPVQNLETKRVTITSQNHGFAVDSTTLPANVKATHSSLFDGTLQGIELTDKAAFSFQGHPEASPGPHDVTSMFDQFMNNMQKFKQA